MPTYYEWDVESVDEHGDIQDHDHCDTLKGYGVTFKPSEVSKSQQLVLVRDVCDQFGSVEDRTWGYVDIESMTLPEYTKDALGCEGFKIPKKFHAELKRWSNVK